MEMRHLPTIAAFILALLVGETSALGAEKDPQAALKEALSRQNLKEFVEIWDESRLHADQSIQAPHGVGRKLIEDLSLPGGCELSEMVSIAFITETKGPFPKRTTHHGYRFNISTDNSEPQPYYIVDAREEGFLVSAENTIRPTVNFQFTNHYRIPDASFNLTQNIVIKKDQWGSAVHASFSKVNYWKERMTLERIMNLDLDFNRENSQNVQIVCSEDSQGTEEHHPDVNDLPEPGLTLTRSRF